MNKTYSILIQIVLLLLLSGKGQAQQNCLPDARELYRNGDFKQAIDLLQSCDIEEKNNAYTELLVSCYFQSGDLKSARREVQVIADSNSTISLISLKARIAFARGEYESAYHYFHQLHNVDSTNNNYIRHLALSSDKLDSTTLAISYYRKTLVLNPSDLVSGIRLVERYMSLDSLVEADSLSQSLIAIDSLSELLRLRGDVLYRLKDYTGAWSCYEPLLRKGTSNPDLLRKAGICKFVNGETEQAITMLSTAHIIQPDDEITCYYLALAYQSKPDYKSSELYFKSAISNGISQNMSNYYHRMGDMYETGGNYAKALDAFQNAIKYRDENDKIKPELQYQVGRLYEVYFEDYKSAILYYEQFLDSYADTSDNKYKGIKTRKEALEKLMK